MSCHGRLSGLSGLFDIAVSGSHIFVTSTGAGTVAEYNTDGTTVNASLISGLSTPTGIAVLGSDIFVVNEKSGTIGEYGTDGTTVNASLISGLNNRPYGIVVTPSAVPKPSSLVMMGFGSVALLAALHRRRGTA